METSEEFYGKKLVECQVPADLHGGIVRYLVNRMGPGSCLTAVFANDLMEAFGRADNDTAFGMKALAAFVYNYMPNVSHGSYERVEKWLAGES